MMNSSQIKNESKTSICRVSVNVKGLHAYGCISFEAQAGKEYKVQTKYLQYSVSFLLQKLESGKTVGRFCEFDTENS
jgi:hypothetical protein